MYACIVKLFQRLETFFGTVHRGLLSLTILQPYLKYFLIFIGSLELRLCFFVLFFTIFTLIRVGTQTAEDLVSPMACRYVSSTENNPQYFLMPASLVGGWPFQIFTLLTVRNAILIPSVLILM